MIPQVIKEKIGRNLHQQPNHPLYLIKNKIQNFFQSSSYALNHLNSTPFIFFDSLPPEVSIKSNFDDLLIPKDHVSRSPKDTFYIDENTVLRTHTSAHQNELLKLGNRNFLVTGDVYRRDTVDATHYPVFHQTEGVWVIPKKWAGFEPSQGLEDYVSNHLHKTLEALALHLFGNGIKCRWVDCYFPFTNPSWELEIFFNDSWLEVLGCGLIENEILKNNGLEDHIGWAFGLGLERLAMILFQIPDIRLFWTEDHRFLEQFNCDNPVFKPYSKYPCVTKDISFWITSDYHENDLHQLIRDVGKDLIEEVKLIDNFVHPKTNRINHTYRITYRSMDRNLTNEEINNLQELIRSGVLQLPVELR